MRVLAFDIAQNTGVAVGDAGGTPEYWSVFLGESHEARLSKALHMTANLIGKYKPDLIAIENVVGRKKTPHINVKIIGCVEGVAHDRGVKKLLIEVKQVRTYFLGFNPTVKQFVGLKESEARKQIKQTVIAACKLRGWNPKDDDSADALAIWEFACAKHSPRTQKMPAGGLFK